VSIKVSSIGWRQDYDDLSCECGKKGEVNDHGAILLRPDRFVAWRCEDALGGYEQKLGLVMRALSLEARNF
jgi:hypothetical protein